MASPRLTSTGGVGTALDSIVAICETAASAFYRATAHEVRAFGFSVDPDTFERVLLLHAERVKGTPQAEGNSEEEIRERGWIDIDLRNEIQLRIVVKG